MQQNSSCITDDIQKLAVVSSYDDFCGIAIYSKALIKGLSQYYDATVIPLDREILHKGNAKDVANYIHTLCKSLKDFDCVSIQFEPGLFCGSCHSSIKKNLFKIIKASKRVVITMHSFQVSQSYPSFIQFGKKLLSWRLSSYIAKWIEVIKNNRWAKLYHSILKFCIDRDVPIIFHNQRDRTYVNLKYSYDQAYDHPLCYNDQDSYKHIISNFTRRDFCKKFALDEKKKFIGIFGFINEYKGHKTAIRALEHLPSEYELLIFGSQHPQSIKVKEEINDYINDLLRLIQQLNLFNRVKFFRVITEDEFTKAMLYCDYNILPYLEVNQGGSGIAALTLETSSKAIFSQNFAFLELSKYAPNAFKMFSIGNYLELANAILCYQHADFESNLQEYLKKYNLSTSILLYRNLLSPSLD
jgi:glycosyltransferase involved in cell wall biosynthesis